MTQIKITWRDGDDIPLWDEKCINVVERFGLPGGRSRH